MLVSQSLWEQNLALKSFAFDFARTLSAFVVSCTESTPLTKINVLCSCIWVKRLFQLLSTHFCQIYNVYLTLRFYVRTILFYSCVHKEVFLWSRVNFWPWDRNRTQKKTKEEGRGRVDSYPPRNICAPCQKHKSYRSLVGQKKVHTTCTRLIIWNTRALWTSQLLLVSGVKEFVRLCHCCP